MLQPGKHLCEHRALLFVESVQQIADELGLALPVVMDMIPALNGQGDKRHPVIGWIIAAGNHPVLFKSLQVAGNCCCIDFQKFLQCNLTDLGSPVQLLQQPEAGWRHAGAALEFGADFFVQGLQQLKDLMFIRLNFAQD